MKSLLEFLNSLFTPFNHDRVLLVGGSVRDFLLARESQDTDLVAALSHQELLALGFRLVEPKSSTTIYFKFHHQFGKIEVTRIESLAELENDLLRRDFTTNAMAMSLSGNLIDPLDGRKDMESRSLRACSAESFLIDPLRIFRGLRFESLGWRMTPETEMLIRSHDWSQRFSSIAVQRFSNEMIKALAGELPERFFQGMLAFDVGREFLPELFRLSEIPAGPLEYHPEGDLLSHSLQVLQRVAQQTGDPLTRFCAFFHDLGKLATDPACYPRHHGHDQAGFGMAGSFCQRLSLAACYRKSLAWVSRLHGNANSWGQLRDSTRIRMAEQAVRGGIDTILPLVSRADKPGGLSMPGWDAAVRVAKMTTAELGIDRVKLESMPVAGRSDYLLQKRVEMLRLVV